MRRRSGSRAARALRCPFSVSAVAWFAAIIVAAGVAGTLRAEEQSAWTISREVKEIFNRSAKAVVKIHGNDKHGKLAGTGFFVDPTGTLYTAFSVGAEADDFTVELDGKEIPAHQVLADRRSGLAILKV